MKRAAGLPDRRCFTWRGLLRPFLTLILTTGLFVASAYMVTGQMLAPDLWFSSWMQVIGMMIAFFFGERAALKTHDEEAERRTPAPAEAKP